MSVRRRSLISARISHDDFIWHGERSNGAWFLDYTCIDVEYLVCTLVVLGWAEEYSREYAGRIVFVIVWSLWASV